MTSERILRARHLLVALVMTCTVGACTPRLVTPERLTATESALWGVAPFANESGVSRLDTTIIADAFTEEAQDVRGLSMVPVNRVLAAMERLGLPDVMDASAAAAICRELRLDGLVVGSVTAYDPYNPPKLGLAVEIYEPISRRPIPDARDLTRAASGADTRTAGTVEPTAQASGLFDGRHHDTLAELAAYTDGRSTPDGAFGADVYLVRMDLFARFACHRLLRDLLVPSQLAGAEAPSD